MKSILIVQFIVIAGFAGFLSLGSENAQAPPTFVSGIQYDGAGGPWTTGGSPYIVVGNINVPVGQTLTIEAGVEVKFDGYYGIYIDGNLTAVGTEGNRINITSNASTPATGNWDRIRANSGGHIDLEFCNIAYGSVGIDLWSTNNYIENITASHNSQYGAVLVSKNTIVNSTIHDNNFGIVVGLNNVIQGNDVFNNDYKGIGSDWFLNTYNNTIIYNNITNNDYGIGLKEAQLNEIANNTISFGNVGIGLYDGSHNNTIANNTIYKAQDYGIILSWFSSVSEYNKLYHNMLVENSVQAADFGSTNEWDDGYPSGGNYWSDYSPTCQDFYDGAITPQTTGSTDGICDFPYNIDADSTDFYPLKIDIIPPNITNLQPPNSSTTKNTKPPISADYDDASGINVTTVLLKFNDTDVTSSATVTESGVSYTPQTALADGTYTVYLEVKDNSSNQNKATRTWSFTVDTKPPDISNVLINSAGTQTYPLSAIPPLILIANVSDSTNGNSNIAGANYTLGVQQWATSQPMVLQNPPTSPTEIFEATLLPPVVSGTYYYYVYAWDDASNYNTTSAAYATLILIDDIPPEISNVTVNGQSSVDVAPGTIVTLTAMIDDTFTGSSNIGGANYTIGLNNWPGISMNAVNPPFDDPMEAVVVMIDTTNWLDGSYNLNVHAWDRESNYNTTYADYVTIIISPDTTSPTANAGNDENIEVGDTINFNGNATTDNFDNLDQLNFTWNITKEGVLIITLYGVAPSLVFYEEGQYEVNLTVRDTTDNVGYDTIIVTVTSPIEPKDFLAEYWWIFLIAGVAIIIGSLLFLVKRKRKPEKESEEEVGETEGAE